MYKLTKKEITKFVIDSLSKTGTKVTRNQANQAAEKILSNFSWMKKHIINGHYINEGGYCYTCRKDIKFPEAPHTIKGQKEAEKAWIKHITPIYERNAKWAKDRLEQAKLEIKKNEKKRRTTLNWNNK